MLVQDVPTRWNSTFYMLERAFKLKNFINSLLAEPHWQNKFGIAIKKKDWGTIEKVVTVLKDFAEVTDRLSFASACVSEVPYWLTYIRSYLVFRSFRS